MTVGKKRTKDVTSNRDGSEQTAKRICSGFREEGEEVEAVVLEEVVVLEEEEEEELSISMDSRLSTAPSRSEKER